MQGFVLSSRKLDFASWTLHMKCIIYRLSVCRRSLGECIPENFSCCWNRFFFFQQSGLNLRRKKKKSLESKATCCLDRTEKSPLSSDTSLLKLYKSVFKKQWDDATLRLFRLPALASLKHLQPGYDIDQARSSQVDRSVSGLW